MSTATLRDTLIALPKTQLLDMFRTLRGDGTVGFDHERTVKSECVNRLLAAYDEEQITAALPAANPAPAVAPSDAGNQLAALITSLAGNSVNEQRVREIVAAEVAEMADLLYVTKMEITRPDLSVYKVPGHVRDEFQDILVAASCGLNIMLAGPAGCGKTHLAHQVADALGRSFASISCTAGMSESALTGWMLPGNNGSFEYVPSDFVTMYEQGGVFLFDEFDAADSNTLLFVNQALANGSFYLPQRKGATKVTRHADFVCIAAANTLGTGANMTYTGRERLDEATLDRFRAGTVLLDYDKTFEKAAVNRELLSWGWDVRNRIRAARLSRVLSTRFLLDATKLMAAGRTLNQIKETFFTGWKADERQKVEA